MQRAWRREELARKTLANTLITLRNAQVRRISWVRGVRPARGGASGLLMTPFPAGHVRTFAGERASGLRAPRRATALAHGSSSSGARLWRAPWMTHRRAYLILDSRNSTCFLATGSYFFLTNLSVIVREFLRVT